MIKLVGEHAPVRMLVDPVDHVPLATSPEECAADGYKLSVDMAKIRAAAKLKAPIPE
jgi:hypothetical protein